jgi:hypothetical protein
MIASCLVCLPHCVSFAACFSRFFLASLCLLAICASCANNQRTPRLPLSSGCRTSLGAENARQDFVVGITGKAQHLLPPGRAQKIGESECGPPELPWQKATRDWRRRNVDGQRTGREKQGQFDKKSLVTEQPPRQQQPRRNRPKLSLGKKEKLLLSCLFSLVRGRERDGRLPPRNGAPPPQNVFRTAAREKGAGERARGSTKRGPCVYA